MAVFKFFLQHWSLIKFKIRKNKTKKHLFSGVLSCLGVCSPRTMKGREVTTFAIVSPPCLSPAEINVSAKKLHLTDRYRGTGFWIDGMEAAIHVILQWMGFKHEGLCCHSRLELQTQVSDGITLSFGIKCIAANDSSPYQQPLLLFCGCSTAIWFFTS